MMQHVLYQAWYHSNVMCEDPLLANIEFSKLWQNVQIRSCSEAMAETVGSIMNQLVGKTGACSLKLF